MTAKKKTVLAGHVWMKNTKGFEMQLPKADAVQLTHGKKGFVFLYPEDDPRSKGDETPPADTPDETSESEGGSNNAK